MIKSLRGKTPKIAASAYISELACIIGDVEIGEDSSVWPGAREHTEENSVSRRLRLLRPDIAGGIDPAGSAV